MEELEKICLDNKAKYFIPVCAPATEELDSVVGSNLAKKGVTVLHCPNEWMVPLNNKHEFCKLMKKKGLAVPHSYIVENDEDTHKLNEQL